MSLGMELGLGPGDFVLDRDPAPPLQKGQIFGPCLLRPNGWMDEGGILGMEVGLSPGDFVLDGDPVPFPKWGGAPSPFCGPFLLWPKCHLVWTLVSAPGTLC